MLLYHMHLRVDSDISLIIYVYISLVLLFDIWGFALEMF